MTRRPKITFVGPIHSQRAKRGKAASEFTIVQDNGAIKLEYQTKDEAHAARRSLLGDHLSYAVESNKLLQAIHKAMQDAKAENMKSDQTRKDDVECGVEDDEL